MSPQKAKSEAVSFLQSIDPTGPWSVAAINPETGGIPKFLTSSDMNEVSDWIEHYRDGWNLYFQDNRAKIAPRAQRYRKIQKEMLASVRFIKADIDRDENGVRLVLSDAKDKMAQRLMAGEFEPGPPTYLIDSGNGLQALWRYSDEFNLEADPDKAGTRLREAEGISRTVSASLGADSCWSANHLFRLPGTMNYPDARKKAEGLVAVPTRLLHADKARRYDPIDCPYNAELAASISVGSLEIAAPVVKSIDDLTHEYRLPHALVQKIVNEPEGNRSELEWNVCLALLEIGLPPEEVHGVLLNEEFGISSRTYDTAKNGNDPEAYSRKTVLRAVQKDQQRRVSEFSSFVDAIAPEEEGGAVNVGDIPKFRMWHRFTPDDLMLLPEPAWLVKDVVIENGVVCVYGAPKVGKTFHVLHLALCVATGRPFFGIPVKRGRVLYLMSEGNRGEFRARIKAWCVANGVDFFSLRRSFEVVFDPVELDNEEHIKGFLSVDPGPYDLQVFDTLKNSMTGDENKAQDMGKALKGANFVRLKTKAAVLFVHHTNKAGDVERGSGALRGAVDSMFRIGLRDPEAETFVETVMTTTHNRAAGDIEPIYCRKETVYLDDDVDNPDRRKSLALVQMAPPPVVDKDRKKGKGGKFEKELEAEDLLAEILDKKIERWKDLVDEELEGRALRSIQRHVAKLVEDGFLNRVGGARSGKIGLTEKGAIVANEKLLIGKVEIPTEEKDEGQ